MCFERNRPSSSHKLAILRNATFEATELEKKKKQARTKFLARDREFHTLRLNPILPCQRTKTLQVEREIK